MTAQKATGRCLCGAVSFEAAGDLTGATACHCSQCRKWSGHFWASVNAPFAGLKITGEDKLAWYESSSYARRGFCSVCGSSLFWHADRHETYRERIAIAAGALDAPTGVETDRHIFCADKGDYYKIADGAPQAAAGA